MKSHKILVKICRICRKICSKRRFCRKGTNLVLKFCGKIDKITIENGDAVINLQFVYSADFNDEMKTKGYVDSDTLESNIKKEDLPVNDFYSIEQIRLFDFDKIDIDRRKQISQKAIEIRKKCNIASERFDVLKVLSVFFGFAIRAITLEDSDVTGMLLVDDEHEIDTGIKRLIAINSNVVRDKDNGMQRTRFIALHEFGHFILHKGDSLQFAKRDTGHFDTTEEFEAEYFAYCMLMPEDLVRRLVNKEDSNENNIRYISKTFGVTVSKATNRLRELGMLVN
jgi:hypothetical protein